MGVMMVPEILVPDTVDELLAIWGDGDEEFRLELVTTRFWRRVESHWLPFRSRRPPCEVKVMWHPPRPVKVTEAYVHGKGFDRARVCELDFPVYMTDLDTLVVTLTLNAA